MADEPTTESTPLEHLEATLEAPPAADDATPQDAREP
jgi:hypothetical protein